MSERERNVDAGEGVDPWRNEPAAGDDAAGSGWEAWETPADETSTLASAATAAAGRRGVLGGLQPPWLLGALSAVLVVAAGAVTVAALRRGLGLTLDARGLVALGLAAGGTLGLAGLAGWAVSTFAESYRLDHLRHRDLVARLAALDLESDTGWHDQELLAEPALSRFLDAVLARDRLQRQSLARACVLEGELARFGTGLAARDRAIATGTYETAAVRRAAAGVTLLYEESDQHQRAQSELEAKLSEVGGQAVAAAAEARRWQAQSQTRVGGLLSALQHVASDAQRLGAAFEEKLRALDEIEQRGVPTIADVQSTLPAAGAGEPAGQLIQAAHAIKDLVARGGSLAIQTALEVTRLGERGETLFPLTESLKSLVTEFQGIATRLEKAAREQETSGQAVAKARGQLTEIAAASGRDIPEPEAWRRGSSRMGELKVALVRAGADLGGLAQTFAEQGGRLEALVGVLADLTGQPCEDLGKTAPAGGPAGFEIESFGGPALGQPEALSAAAASAATAATAASPTTSRLFADDDSPDAPRPATRPLVGSIFAAEEPRIDAFAPAQPPDPELSKPEERVYDLAELGAVALDGPLSAAETDDDRIYDLVELGAVAIG